MVGVEKLNVKVVVGVVKMNENVMGRVVKMSCSGWSIDDECECHGGMPSAGAMKQ